MSASDKFWDTCEATDLAMPPDESWLMSLGECLGDISDLVTHCYIFTQCNVKTDSENRHL